MFVGERMSRHPVTITPDTSLHDALQIMRDEKVRRLPVLDKKGKLVGIVLEKDLLYASPSPATSLSVYELNYLVAKIKVADIMAPEVITTEEGCPLEEAARIMADNQIGGLPVMRGDQLVGMITESEPLFAPSSNCWARAHGGCG
jgi:acetoin utilization protein AcuB